MIFSKMLNRFNFRIFLIFLGVLVAVMSLQVVWLMAMLPRNIHPLPAEHEITGDNELYELIREGWVPWGPYPWGKDFPMTSVLVVATPGELRKFFSKEDCIEVETGRFASIADFIKNLGKIPEKLTPAPKCLLAGRHQDLSFVRSVPKARNGRYFWRLPLRDKDGRPFWACVNESHGNTDNIALYWGGAERREFLLGPDNVKTSLYIIKEDKSLGHTRR